MKDAQRPDHMSLASLIGRLRDGRFAVPDFQREFEWKPWDIRDLMRSIFLDYYIGSLLLWKGKPATFQALACEPLYGYPGDGGEREHIVLDGQQRLTAMYYTFLAPDVPLPNRSNRFLYFIRVDQFMDEVFDEAFRYDWTRGALTLLANERQQFERHMFPLSVIGKGGWEIYEWINGYQKYWQEKSIGARDAGEHEAARMAAKYADDAKEFGSHVKGIVEEYQVSYIELDRDLELDKVCDIFTQINSRGIRLDVFDLINALLKPKGLQLKHLWRRAAQRLNFVETERMNVYVLQVMSILLQSYCSPKYLYYLLPGQEKKVRDPDGALRTEILVRDVEQFSDLWDRAVNAIDRAIELLKHPQEYGAIASDYLPYVSILPAFSALHAAANERHPNRRIDARRKIRRWYWASVFTNRYSGSIESTTARDYLEVKAWFDDDDAEPGVIKDFRNRFRRLELRREVKRGTSVYNGIFNLFVLNGARDWMTGDAPRYGDLSDYHIVPKWWGRDNGLATDIDTILNRVPLTSEAKSKILGESLPNEYLPKLVEANGEGTVRTILESHFISPLAFDILTREPFTASDFEEFINERQRTIQDAIQDLLIKERMDLSPDLRELDGRIESVELRLRDLIRRVLTAADAGLPPHVEQRVDERLQRAFRRDPAMDKGHYSSLEGKLEYADLRELETVIQSTQLRPLFADLLGGTDIISVRFAQLAELRNAIRHSRAVSGVARREGEAALLWFEGVLERAVEPTQLGAS